MKLFSFDLGFSFVVLTQIRKEVTVNRDKTGRVVILGPAINLDEVQVRAVIHVVVLAVAERDLKMKNFKNEGGTQSGVEVFF